FVCLSLSSSVLLFYTFLYRGFNSLWFSFMQIILILRSIRTFAIKNLSEPSYQGFCLRWMIGWLRSIIAWFYRIFYRNFILPNQTLLAHIIQHLLIQCFLYYSPLREQGVHILLE